MEITIGVSWERVEKSIMPSKKEWETGLLLWKHGVITRLREIRIFNNDGRYIAGSSDDVTEDIDCWFRMTSN